MALKSKFASFNTGAFDWLECTYVYADPKQSHQTQKYVARCETSKQYCVALSDEPTVNKDWYEVLHIDQESPFVKDSLL